MATDVPAKGEKQGEVQGEEHAEQGMETAQPLGLLATKGDDAEQQAQGKAEEDHSALGLQGIVEHLGFERERRGQHLAGFLLLEEFDLGNHGLCAIDIVGQDRLDEIVHGVIDKLKLCLGNAPRELRAAWGVPFQPTLRRERKEMEHLTIVEHRDDLHLLVHLAKGLALRIGERTVPYSVLEFILMLRGIEIVDRSPLALYAKQLLHLLALHPNDRLRLPFRIEYHPAQEDLIGREALPGALATQFGDKLRSGSIQRTDAAVVEHSDAPHRVGYLAVDRRDGRFGYRGGGGEKEEKQDHGSLGSDAIELADPRMARDHRP